MPFIFSEQDDSFSCIYMGPTTKSEVQIILNILLSVCLSQDFNAHFNILYANS